LNEHLSTQFKSNQLKPVIKVENLSKQYRLGQVGSSFLKDDIRTYWDRLRGKENRLHQLGDINDRSIKGESDYVWSLKDINFEVNEGEVLGIIGRNGAGKSTLLKILSRITSPTTGKIQIRGRFASLLEVGTGFHPELSGLENIYLNGAILGMKRKEIDKKLDEIIDFSGVERYIDTPVKRYSSGMYVRLAFAVAAHLDSEILMIDEVLAVGDAEFQKKCLGKMQNISKNEGRTVLFVSHNNSAIHNFCNQCLLLDKGLLLGKNDTEMILREYQILQKKMSNDSLIDRKNRGNNTLTFKDFSLKNPDGLNNCIDPLKVVVLSISYEMKTNHFEKIRIDIGINNLLGERIAWFSSDLVPNFKLSPSNLEFQFKSLPLVPGEYTISLYCENNGEVADWIEEMGVFEIMDLNYYGTGKNVGQDKSKILLDLIN